MSRVVLNINDRQGYTAEQVKSPMSLGELLDLVNTAIDMHGEDTEVILFNGDELGAAFGSIARPAETICYCDETGLKCITCE